MEIALDIATSRAGKKCRVCSRNFEFHAVLPQRAVTVLTSASLACSLPASSNPPIDDCFPNLTSIGTQTANQVFNRAVTVRGRAFDPFGSQMTLLSGFKTALAGNRQDEENEIVEVAPGIAALDAPDPEPLVRIAGRLLQVTRLPRSLRPDRHGGLLAYDVLPFRQCRTSAQSARMRSAR